MAGEGFLVIATLVVLATATMVTALSVSGEFQRVLTLERAFPVGNMKDMEAIKARDRARHARVMQTFSGGVVNFPVGGTSDPFAVGLYYSKVRIGSPPQEFNVQIDTGSDILWVACRSCTNCPKSSGLGIPLASFDIAASSSVSPISCTNNICASMVEIVSAECSTESSQCEYSFQYGDGSGTTGFYASDILYLDTISGTSSIANSSASIVFGCSTSMYGDLSKSERAVDGIFGFGQHGFSVISQLSSSGVIPKVFSHCLKGKGNGGGILVLGEILDPSIVYTPLVPSQPHYNLYLQSIAVNGQLLPIDQAVFATSSNRGTIVDSGTTLAYLVEGAYDPLVDAISAAVSSSAKPITSNGNQCYLLSTSVDQVFPSVAFNFAGSASLVLKPVDYLVPEGFMDGASMWCIGFLKVQNQGTTILGDLVLKDKVFVYDLANQRIGWADYDCSSWVNVSITFGRDEYVGLSVSGRSSVSDKNCHALVLYLLVVLFGVVFL